MLRTEMSAGADISTALLQFLTSNQFPDTEEVASASVHAGSLPDLTDGLRNARKSLENDIRNTSRRSAKDVDGWIAQAKQLQQDIEASRKTARDIVKEAETAKHLQRGVGDFQKRISSLEKELHVDESLADVLKSIRSLVQLSVQAETAIDKGNLLEASNYLQACELSLKKLKCLSSITCVNVIKDKIQSLKLITLKKANEIWEELLSVDLEQKVLRISRGSEDVNKLNLSDINDTLSNLGRVEDALAKLSQKILSHIIIPCLSGVYGVNSTIEIKGNELWLIRSTIKEVPVNAVYIIRQLIEFLNSNLPNSLQVSLSNYVMQPITLSLRRYWLESSMQKSLEGMQLFDDEAQALRQLALDVDDFGWSGKDLLLELIKSIPRLWITRRKETALANVRSICLSNVSSRIAIDKQEPQKSGEEEFVNEMERNEWASEWPDEAVHEAKADSETKHNYARPGPSTRKQSDRIPKSPSRQDYPPEPEADTDERKATDDWDWRNEDAKSSILEPESSKDMKNGTNVKPDQIDQRSVRLVRCTITSVPDTLVEAIKRLAVDAGQLSQPSLQHLSISAARTGLYSIPVLMMALYRAVALTYYSQDPIGSMLLYNDIARFVECLQSLQQKLDPEVAAKLRLDPEVKSLMGFRRRAYEREIETQRLIIRDLLDTAQGFTNCASPAFALEGEKAITMVVDRILTLHNQWKDVLTPSILLQSLGSLCTTILGKIIVDIEDMSDISEDESKKLKEFCDEVSKVRQVFSEETHGSGSVDYTAMFISNWFKFQYLAEILESSLADIKYLWTEGELGLEFEAEEVIDLIEALFAESDYRRKTVNEIKRSSQQ